MEFRWIGLIALWTLLSGPILGVSTSPAPGSANPPSVSGQKLLKTVEEPSGRR